MKCGDVRTIGNQSNVVLLVAQHRQYINAPKRNAINVNIETKVFHTQVGR